MDERIDLTLDTEFKIKQTDDSNVLNPSFRNHLSPIEKMKYYFSKNDANDEIDILLGRERVNDFRDNEYDFIFVGSIDEIKENQRYFKLAKEVEEVSKGERCESCGEEINIFNSDTELMCLCNKCEQFHDFDKSMEVRMLITNKEIGMI